MAEQERGGQWLEQQLRASILNQEQQVRERKLGVVLVFCNLKALP